MISTTSYKLNLKIVGNENNKKIGSLQFFSVQTCYSYLTSVAACPAIGGVGTLVLHIFVELELTSRTGLKISPSVHLNKYEESYCENNALNSYPLS